MRISCPTMQALPRGGPCTSLPGDHIFTQLCFLPTAKAPTAGAVRKTGPQGINGHFPARGSRRVFQGPCENALRKLRPFLPFLIGTWRDDGWMEGRRASIYPSAGISWSTIYKFRWSKSESKGRSVVSDSCDPIAYTVHGILQARILEWVAVPFSRDSFQPRDWTQVFGIAGGFFTS